MPKKYTKQEFQKKYANCYHINAGVHYIDENGVATFDYIFGSASQIISHASLKGDDFLYIVTK